MYEVALFKLILNKSNLSMFVNMKMLSNLKYYPNYDLVKCALSINRYLSEISNYKRDLMMDIPQTIEHLPVSII